MSTNTRVSTRTKRIAFVIAIATLILTTAASASAGGASRYDGTFHETQAGADLGYDIHGSAKMTTSDSGTVVKVHIVGLDPAKVYGSHLHNGTCESGGGGHYQDIENGSKLPPNELHITTSGTILESNPGGVANTSGSAPWQARVASTTQTNALSVVVHEPGGARIACADLT